ncbi:MAG: FHA domain-containing protein [Actinomycetales bacterium]|nr:FHA domain-containing protein [Actinomycetales bacterium]
MTTCEACGSPLPAGAEFCPVCAAPAPAPPSVPAPAAPGSAAPGPAAPAPGGRGPTTTAAPGADTTNTVAASPAAAPVPYDAPPTGPPVAPSLGSPAAPPSRQPRESWWRRLTGSRSRASTPHMASVPPPPQAGPVSAGPVQPAPVQPAPSAPAPRQPVEIAPEPGPLIAAVPGFSRPVEEPVAVPPSPAPVPDEPPATPRAAEPEGAATPGTAVGPGPSLSLTPAPEPTPASTSQPAPAPQPAQEAEPADDVDQTRLAGPEERGPVVLVLPGGERLTVEGRGVLGRNPAARVGEEGEVTHLVPVADPTRSVSKTHLAFGLDTVGLWIEDLHSTNGTAVVSQDGTRTPLTAGLAVHVSPGDVVVVGDVDVAVTR